MDTKLNIMAIDLATNHFGYCFFHDTELKEYSNKEISKLSKISELEREKYVYNFFKEKIAELKPDLIISEYFFLRTNPKVFGKLQMMQGILMSLSFENNANYKIYDIGHYRKILGIKARKSVEIKEEIKQLVLKKYPYVIVDKECDISDAISIALAYQLENKIIDKL